MTTRHLQALSPETLAAARKLSPLSALRDFYLAGGTALALHYGHRVSLDLDFFSQNNTLNFTGRQALLNGLLPLGALVEEEKDGTLHARLKETHISFFHYPNPLVKTLDRWEGLHLAQPMDIGIMKVGAIIGRGSRKDFYDLQAIIENEIGLKQLLSLAEKKYPYVRDIQLQAMKALVFFDDADQEPSPLMIKPFPWNNVKRFFEHEVRKMAGNLK